MYLMYNLLLYVIYLIPCFGNDVTSFIGHKKKFGAGKMSTEFVETRHTFPDFHDFFKNFVLQSKPLKMTGVISNSLPHTKWTDEYFLSLNLSNEDLEDVTVETKKKENRKQPAMAMDFQEFVRTYNTTDNYMVQKVPRFLSKDVVIPYPLQCDQIYNGNIVESIMWYSSGGTKSVVHTDSVENINCLYHGQKEFVIVNPHKFGDKVDLDHPEGAYSDIDVDEVDYNQYPGLAEVEYMFVNMSAGDCLYIPFKWIHQVRSFNRNIAVNIWWDHYASKEIDLDMCPYAAPDNSLTLDKVVFQGLGQHSLTAPVIKDFFSEMTRKGPIAVVDFFETLISDIPVFREDAGKGYERYFHKIAGRIDKNGDDHFTLQEINEATEEDWDFVTEQVAILEDIAQELESTWSEVNKVPVEELYRRYTEEEGIQEQKKAMQQEEEVMQQKVMQQEEEVMQQEVMQQEEEMMQQEVKDLHQENIEPQQENIPSDSKYIEGERSHKSNSREDRKKNLELQREEEQVHFEYDPYFEDDLDLKVRDYENDMTNSVDRMEDHDEL